MPEPDTDTQPPVLTLSQHAAITLHKMIQEKSRTIPPALNVSNEITRLGCVILSELLDGATWNSPLLMKAIIDLIEGEVEWLRKQTIYEQWREENRPVPAKRYQTRGPAPMELTTPAYQRLKEVGLSYNHKTKMWSGWQTDEMVITANDLLSVQGKLI